MSTPGEERWKEMVAQLALRTGMTPLDVEAATEGRIRAAEITELIARSSEPGQSTPPVVDGAPPDDAASAGMPEQSPQ
jgi:hypothetical protein